MERGPSLAAVLPAAIALGALAVVVGGTSEAEAYRLRLARPGTPPADLYNSVTGVWNVQDLRFFADERCATGELAVSEAVASVGSTPGRAGLAFDGLLGTSWTSACHAGEDALLQCQESWSGGAWLGARLAAAANVSCVMLVHNGAQGGVILEGWSASSASWVGLQEFGPDVPSTSGDSRVLLRRLPGGTCDSLAPSTLVLPPQAVASSFVPAVLDRWTAADDVWSDESYNFSDLGDFTSQAFDFRVRTSYVQAEASYTLSLPAGAPLRVYVLSRGAGAPALLPAAGWEAACGAMALPAVDVDGTIWRYTTCAASTLFPGSELSIPPPHGSTVEIFLRAMSEIPLPACLAQTQWRLVALDALASWSVYELQLYEDSACLDELGPGFEPITAGSSPSQARRSHDGSLATAWSASCPAGGCDAGSVWIGLAFDGPRRPTCISVFQRHSVVGSGGAGTAPAGFALQLWNGDGWEAAMELPPLMNGEWTVWANTSQWQRWRLINDAPTVRAWALPEVSFLSDAECTRPIDGGVAFSSAASGSASGRASRAFDGDASTVWLSDCAPCAMDKAYIGKAFDAPKAVRCVALTLSSDDDFRPSSVRLEYWALRPDNVSYGWQSVGTFRSLAAGLQLLTPAWLLPKTRFAIRNTAFALNGWRIAELRFFSDVDCIVRVGGLGISFDGDTADAARAFDDSVATFWYADCCAARTMSLEQCFGCAAGEAYIGISVISVDTDVRCLQVVQAGEVQLRGAAQYATDRLALLEWNGIAYDVVYEWSGLIPNDWMQLSVGRAWTSLGSGMGCNDIQDWQACPDFVDSLALPAAVDDNSTALSPGLESNTTRVWNCTTYAEFGLCNATFQEHADCTGVPLRLACRRSCCLCESGKPAECGGGDAAAQGLPPWLIPAAVAAAMLLLLAIGLCYCYKRGCPRYCRCCSCCSRPWGKD